MKNLKIKNHLNKFNNKDLANDFAYLFSQDLDRIRCRLENNLGTREDYINKIIEKVTTNETYKNFYTSI